MLDESPGNPWHVGTTPSKNFPAFMEELDERAFLCGIQVYCDGSSLVGVRGMNPNFLRNLVLHRKPDLAGIDRHRVAHCDQFRL
jgi:hypothetical protein